VILLKKYPTLFSKSTNGTKEWTISVYQDHDIGIISSYYGLVIGKKQSSIVRIDYGKNIGKRNETTAIEQALKEAESKWFNKFKTSFETLEELDTIGSKFISPMLALKFKTRSHDIKYPCLIQPKLDGVRCISESFMKDLSQDIKYTSRTGMEFYSLDILNKPINEIFKYIKNPLDGEIFTFDIDFEEIISAVRRNKKLNVLKDKLQYWVYDIVDVNLDFINRNKMTQLVFTKLGTLDVLKDTYHIGNIYMCPTYVANSKEEVLEYHEKFIESGYEGTIIRNAMGVYRLGPSRSKNLQKLKNFITDEFEIVNIVDGIGKDENTAIFICRAKNGRQFRVKPEGSYEQRHEWFLSKEHLIGKQLTVSYHRLSRYGIPKFATGITVRDYE
jgi:DNA ligase-1